MSAHKQLVKNLVLDAGYECNDQGSNLLVSLSNRSISTMEIGIALDQLLDDNLITLKLDSTGNNVIIKIN